MDILIFKINDSKTHIITKLAKLKNTSVYLAVTKDDAFRIAEEIKPEIVIIGNIQEVGYKFLNNLYNHNLIMNIFQLKENMQQSEDYHLFNPRSNKKVNFKNLIEQIKKGGHYV
ncbi:MAG: hypothetical protein K8S23_04070 [Candidatus Cloacimonetes bacterium]|nr:hypothetical protein [Candidatus Cloacimonadota bacterium]